MLINKSFKKRIKITKTGKMLRRTQGQGHSLANKSRRVIKRRQGKKQVSGVDIKAIGKKIKTR